MNTNDDTPQEVPGPARNAGASWVPGKGEATYVTDGTTTEWYALSDPTFEPVARIRRRRWVAPALAAAALTLAVAGGTIAAAATSSPSGTSVLGQGTTSASTSSTTLAGGLPPAGADDGPDIPGADN